MVNPLLITKLYKPPARKEFLLRPRLVKYLSEGSNRKLTLVSAPAGFGKTILVSQWIREVGYAAIWISLDEGDNDPVQFLRYLFRALGSVIPGIEKDYLGLISSARISSIPHIITLLVNDLANRLEPLVIVLDDFQSISNSAVYEAIEFIVENQPPIVHTILITRHNPPLPLARWRAQAELNEIRAIDLRFTVDEAEKFLNERIGLSLTSDAVKVLNERTEGWIAGLQLAAISMQSHNHLEPFIKAFEGNNRHVMDYLTDEVLALQIPEVQDFLLKTSILERMNAPLCDALLGSDHSSDTLEFLRAANLFVVPLDDKGEWYRYHNLFAELLRFRLERMYAGLRPELHQRASTWLETNGFVPEAVEHAIETKNPAYAQQMMERHAQDAVMRGEVRQVIAWIERLPPDILKTSPVLSESAAWAFFLAGRYERVETLLSELELFFESEESTGPKRTAEILALRSFMCRMSGKTKEGIALAEQALSTAPEKNAFLQGLIYTSLGGLYKDAGELYRATEAQKHAIEMNRMAGNMAAVVMDVRNLVMLLCMLGKLQEAQTVCQGAIDSADEVLIQMPAFSAVLVSMGEILYEKNELDGAEICCRDGIALSRRGGFEYAEAFGLMALARVHQAQGRTTSARKLMQEAAGPARKNPPTAAHYAANSIKLMLAQGEIQPAKRWVESQGITPSDTLTPDMVPYYLALARVLLAEARDNSSDHKVAEALNLLERLLELLQHSEQVGTALEVQILIALAHSLRGAGKDAVDVLRSVLPLAAREGFMRIFLDEGESLYRLMRSATDWGLDQGYIERLLTEYDAARREGETLEHASDHDLTRQEMRVLHLIDAGLNNQEIARELTVTLNTVKTHTRNLYSKLYVNSRTQAIVRARELGLF